MKLILPILLFFTAPAMAEDFWLYQTASGNGSGVDSNNCLAASFFNTPANWGGGAGKISAGDTVHLVSNIVTALQFQGGGSAGSPVTLSFSPGATMKTNCWSALTAAIDLNGQSYIVVDGGGTPTANGCVPNGIIANTDNGSPPLTFSNDSHGIQGTGFFFTIKNLTVTNIYHRSNPLDAQRLGFPIGIGGSDITVANCNSSDGDGALFYFGPTAQNTVWSNIYLQSNNVLNFNHGIGIGIGAQGAGPQNCAVTNFVIGGNFFDHSDVWDDNLSPPQHHLDAIFMVADTFDPTVALSYFSVSNNVFGPHVSNQSLSASSATGVFGIFFDYPQAQIRNVVFHNNLVMPPVGGTFTWGNGCYLSGSNVWFVNNTIAGNVATQVSGTNAFMFDNMLLGGQPAEGMDTFTTNVISLSQQATNDIVIISNMFAGVWSDYNCLAAGASTFVGGFQCIEVDVVNNTGVRTWNSGAFDTFGLVGWQTFNHAGDFTETWASAHCDPHSTTATPSLDTNLKPLASDTVTLLGTNLNTVMGGLFARDSAGKTRTPGRIGAFEPLSLVKLRARK